MGADIILDSIDTNNKAITVASNIEEIYSNTVDINSAVSKISSKTAISEMFEDLDCGIFKNILKGNGNDFTDILNTISSTITIGTLMGNYVKLGSSVLQKAIEVSNIIAKKIVGYDKYEMLEWLKKGEVISYQQDFLSLVSNFPDYTSLPNKFIYNGLKVAKSPYAYSPPLVYAGAILPCNLVIRDTVNLDRANMHTNTEYVIYDIATYSKHKINLNSIETKFSYSTGGLFREEVQLLNQILEKQDILTLDDLIDFLRQDLTTLSSHSPISAITAFGLLSRKENPTVSKVYKLSTHTQEVHRCYDLAALLEFYAYTSYDKSIQGTYKKYIYEQDIAERIKGDSYTMLNLAVPKGEFDLNTSNRDLIDAFTYKEEVIKQNTYRRTYNIFDTNKPDNKSNFLLEYRTEGNVICISNISHIGKSDITYYILKDFISTVCKPYEILIISKGNAPKEIYELDRLDIALDRLGLNKSVDINAGIITIDLSSSMLDLVAVIPCNFYKDDRLSEEHNLLRGESSIRLQIDRMLTGKMKLIYDVERIANLHSMRNTPVILADEVYSKMHSSYETAIIVLNISVAKNRVLDNQVVRELTNLSRIPWLGENIIVKYINDFKLSPDDVVGYYYGYPIQPLSDKKDPNIILHNKSKSMLNKVKDNNSFSELLLEYNRIENYYQSDFAKDFINNISVRVSGLKVIN